MREIRHKKTGVVLYQVENADSDGEDGVTSEVVAAAVG